MASVNLDSKINKWISRKLFVFIVSTVGLFTGQITSEDWMILATAYISVQGVTDAVKGLLIAGKGASNGEN